MHGGKSLVGIAHPNFTEGRITKNLPSRLAASFQASNSDPDLLNLRREVSLTDSRIDDLLGRVDSGESGELWRSVRATFTEAEKQRSRWDRNIGSVEGEKAKQSFFEAFEMIGVLTAEGIQDYQAWDEVNKMIDQRLRLAETETKRLEKMGRMVTADRAMTMVAALVGLVKTHVSDRNALLGIIRGLDVILAAETAGRY